MKTVADAACLTTTTPPRFLSLSLSSAHLVDHRWMGMVHLLGLSNRIPLYIDSVVLGWKVFLMYSVLILR